MLLLRNFSEGNKCKRLLEALRLLFPHEHYYSPETNDWPKQWLFKAKRKEETFIPITWKTITGKNYCTR